MPLKGRPGSGGPRLRRRSAWRSALRLVCAALIGVAAGPAATASADEQPAILKAYGLDWIERVREEAWPQPKSERPVICLLDTGVAITADTPADNPDGPIVARLSVEDDPAISDPNAPQGGLPQGKTFAHGHGTRMASIIGAPRNGAGTVGIFPQARIVSVRVTVGAETYIAVEDLVRGVRVCKHWSTKTGVAVAAVVMAESGVEQRAEDVPKWESAAASVKQVGGLFVAAAGNSPDAKVVAPLSAKDVLVAGAGDDNGDLCAFARPYGAGHLVGPGCSSGTPSWFPGSSSAAATVGAIAAVLSSRFPDASVSERHATLLGSHLGDGRLRGALLEKLFLGLINAPQPPPSDNAVSPMTVAKEPATFVDETETISVRLWRPSVSFHWRHGRLHFVRTRRAKAGVLRVRTSERSSPLTLTGRSGSARLKKRPRTVTYWAEGSGQPVWRSLVSRARVGR